MHIFVAWLMLYSCIDCCLINIKTVPAKVEKAINTVTIIKMLIKSAAYGRHFQCLTHFCCF